MTARTLQGANPRRKGAGALKNASDVFILVHQKFVCNLSLATSPAARIPLSVCFYVASYVMHRNRGAIGYLALAVADATRRDAT